MMNSQLRDWWEKIRNSGARQTLLENRNECGKCPLCNGTVSDLPISIYAELAAQLYVVYRWCGEHQRHQFQMKDIRHLLDKNGYTRFASLIRCSNGILYRPGDEDGENLPKGHYGINMGRARAFFRRERTIHLSIMVNQITGEKTVVRDVYVDQIPPLKAMLDKDGLYDYERML